MARRRREIPVTVEISEGHTLVDVVRRPYTAEALLVDMANSPELSETIRSESLVLIHTLNAYQVLAMRTRGEFGDESRLINFSALEIASEAGELANLVYKNQYQGHPLNEEAMIEELGDVLWGIASMADALGVTLRDVAVRNLTKLAKRYSSGRFNTADSIARVDHED